MKKTNNQSDKNELVFFSDSEALFLLVFFYTITIVSYVFISIGLFFFQSKPNVYAFIFMSAIFVALWVSVGLQIHKFGVRVSLTNDKISYKPLFGKEIVKNYDELCHVEIAYYSRIGNDDIKASRKYYVVISDYELSDYERSKINYLSNSQHVIKIEFNKKNYQKLLNILPEGHKVQLIEQFADLVNK